LYTPLSTKNSGWFYKEQFLSFAGSGRVGFTEDDEDEVGIFFWIPDGEIIATYDLEFLEAAESDIDANTDLDDYEDKDISILGKTYSFVQAEKLSGNGVRLTLMSGAVAATLGIGESETYTIDGTDFEAELTFIDDDKCKFLVNGESTGNLVDGETHRLADGTEIGVSEISYQDYAGGVQECEFFLGANKIELEDSDITDVLSSHRLEVNEETIEDADVIIRGSNTTSEVEIDTITVNMTADDDYYVGPGESLSEQPEIDEPEVIFTNNWDWDFVGMSGEATEMIILDAAAGDEEYVLEFTNVGGNTIRVPLFSGEADRFGDDDDPLLITNEPIADEDFFILNDELDEDSVTNVVQYKGSDDSGTEDQRVRFRILGTGETLNRPFRNGAVDLTIDGNTYTFVNESIDTEDDFNLTLTSGGSLNNQLWTEYGALIELGAVDASGNAALAFRGTGNGTYVSGSDGNTWTVNITQKDDDRLDESLSVGLLQYSLNITSVLDDVDFTSTGDGVIDGFQEDPEDDDNNIGYTIYGAFIKELSGSDTNDADELEITYPASQLQAMLYVTSGPITTSAVTTTAGGVAAQIAIPVTATKKASQVTDVSAQNGIYVGGPCANPATAAVMYSSQGADVPADCAQDFTPGEAIIQLYDVGSNVAMVVAGFSADDTTRAGKVLAQTSRYDLSGSQVTVSGTSLEDIEVTKVG